MKRIRMGLTTLFLLVIFSTLTLAVINTAFWIDGSTVLTVDLDETAEFDISVNSIEVNTPWEVVIYNYDSSLGEINGDNFDDFDFLEILDSGAAWSDGFGGGFYSDRIEVAPIDREGAGTYYISVLSAEPSLVNLMESSGGDIWDATVIETITLIVLPEVTDAPVISSLPDVTLEENDVEWVFDLDNYVTDADTALADLDWYVYGENDVTVFIDSDNWVRITPDEDFVGTDLIYFEVEDPEGNWDSDQVLVTVETDEDEEEEGEETEKEASFSTIEWSYNGFDETIKFRNSGKPIKDITMRVFIEAENAIDQIFKFDLNRNTVRYQEIDMEGLEPGVYLAKIELRSDAEDNLKTSKYIVLEKF
ncbi:Ig-like domain-containing protein [Nanoarchaeota archaeon]